MLTTAPVTPETTRATSDSFRLVHGQTFDTATLSVMTITVHESGYRQGSRAVVPEGKGQKFRVRLMGWEPGSKVVEGSSADYPVEAIARDFAESFPPGTRMRANHDGMCEAGGDIRRIFAKTTSIPQRESDGMYADAIAAEGEPTTFLRQFADVIGTSISTACEVEMVAKLDHDGEVIQDENGNPVMVPKRSERGAQIVKRFLSMSENPYNSVDFVEAPGADGAVVSLAVESAKVLVEHVVLREAAGFAIDLVGKREKTSEATPPRDMKEENTVEKEEATAIAEAAATAAVTAYVESLAAPTAPEQPSFGTMAEAVVTAGLTEAGRAAVYTRISAGEGYEAAIATESARESAIEAEVNRRVEAALTESRTSTGHSLDFGFTEDDKTGKPLGGSGKKALEQAEIDSTFEGLED